ncbi:MAG TPA: TetR/AcrR family transcriptional regulator [Sphingomonadales bacterium]|mgnify:CR=1 FL=1
MSRPKKAPKFLEDAIAQAVPGTHQKGKERFTQILETAIDVLAFEGYSKFTMRNIAARLGISLRNLQHYFPTKDVLFKSAVHKMLSDDSRDAALAMANSRESDLERLAAFIRYSIRINSSPRTRGFQFELWAIATRDPFAAECRDYMTHEYCAFIYDVIKPLTPKLSRAARMRKASLLLAMLQGLPLVESESPAARSDGGRVSPTLVREIMDFVLQGQEAAAAAS